ncbi:hypothetical protein HMPREF1624_00152 [Sporothrix schenckii ATCC 58251]|uniref:Peroxin 26 n=1 Tax=Sporothrix schenckii (strain ATCC 58251 / de Perez 2211183) TaxID=1391915 RepID=U7Q1W4_SPOS1|nr:hypothetical protein HMPREF1624_00152 [Sporothrix schenckii ATCC 58251]
MSFRTTYSAGFNPAFGGHGHGNSNGNGNGHSLSSSMSSLSASMHARSGYASRGSLASSNISKTYRQASTLFLTRRLPEALTTLLPLITPPHSDDDDAHSTNGSSKMNGTNGTNDTNGANGTPAAVVEPAPVASASRTTRVKVWSLYLTILNAIVELEADEGKDAFGTQDWRALCTKVRDGDVWEEVVRNGYHGAEGDVDADVVINLATLLLAHAKTQVLNQKRLESYLSFSQSQVSPNLDLSGRFETSLQRRSLSRHRSPARRTPGTDTPRDLNSRVKILELYTLHVLRRNGEWDYAREFITASPILDEERREAFLQALQSLQDEEHEAEQREAEETRRQEEQVQQELDEARRTRAANEARERRRIEEERARRMSGSSAYGGGFEGIGGSEVEYSGDGMSSTSQPRRHKAPSSTAGSTSTRGGGRTRSSKSAKSTAPTSSAPAPAPAPAPSGSAKPVRAPSAPKPKPKSAKGKNRAVAAPPTLGSRTAMLFANLQGFIEQLSRVFQTTPLVLLRTLFFIVALLVMLGRQGNRERIARILGGVWNKVKATAGMGVKVSYI